MKKEELKIVSAKMIAAIAKVLKSSKAEHTKKSEKVIKKSVKSIVKTVNKVTDAVSKKSIT